MEETLITVICLTYNHEKYISRCIDSIINQDTSFKYEILIHDDCSTDSTSKIVKEYAEKYPNLIRTIIQEHNQYSLGINIVDDLVIPISKGEYIAICEGDDYWVDKNKLQRQIEAMRKNDNCWICAHEVQIVNREGSKIIGKIAPDKKNKIFGVDDVIKGDGDFVGTNSLLIKKDAFLKYSNIRKIYPLDYFLQVMGALNGGMLYLNKTMSAYRFCSEGSWTERMQNNKEQFCIHYQRMILALENLDNVTNGKYYYTIRKKINYQKYNLFMLKKEPIKLLQKQNREIFNSLNNKQKIRVWLNVIFPCFDKLIILWRKYAK